ncbi:unnamed protein product, partial [Adineta ricciae]
PCSNIMSPAIMATTTTAPQMTSMFSNQSQRSIIHCLFYLSVLNSPTISYQSIRLQFTSHHTDFYSHYNSTRYTDCILDNSYCHLFSRPLPKHRSISTLHVKVNSNQTVAATRRTRHNLSVARNPPGTRPSARIRSSSIRQKSKSSQPADT